MSRNLDQQLYEDVTGLLASDPGVTLRLSGYEAFLFVAALQLALRHPQYPPNSHEIVEHKTRQLCAELASGGPLAALLAAGWNPAYDRIDEQEADPEVREAIAASIYADAERQEAAPPAFRIERLFAYIGKDSETGDEGVCAFMSQYGVTPMVGADRARIESLRSVADEIAATGQGPIILAEFRTRHELETITS